MCGKVTEKTEAQRINEAVNATVDNTVARINKQYVCGVGEVVMIHLANGIDIYAEGTLHITDGQWNGLDISL